MEKEEVSEADDVFNEQELNQSTAAHVHFSNEPKKVVVKEEVSLTCLEFKNNDKSLSINLNNLLVEKRDISFYNNIFQNKNIKKLNSIRFAMLISLH